MEFRYKHWCGRAERGRTRAPPCRRYSGGTSYGAGGPVTPRADQLWHAETGPPDQIWRRTNYFLIIIIIIVVNTLINILLISLYVFCVCYIIMLGLSVCYIIMLGLSVLTVVGVTFLCTNRNSRFYVSLACLLIFYC